MSEELPCWLCVCLSILELFHGETMAFKDLAMMCTARFLEYFLRKENSRATILVGKQAPLCLQSNLCSPIGVSNSTTRRSKL